MSETALRRHFHIVAGGWTQALMGCLWGGVGHAWSVSGLRDFLQQRYERGSTLVTSNLPFDEWTYVFGSERLTSALLDRLTYHVHILEMNGDSFRLSTSKKPSADKSRSQTKTPCHHKPMKEEPRPRVKPAPAAL